MSKSNPIPDASDKEKTTLRDDYDSVTVVRSTSGHKTALHIPHPEKADTPLCTEKREHNGNSPLQQKDCHYSDKDIACYPPGWAEWCAYCVEWWREND